MPYKVNRIYYTLQGEGANTGRPAIFVRFAGCNLWSGREQDRETATCRFCDTDFVGGDVFSDANSLAQAIEDLASADSARPMVVLTGGEPALHVDQRLIDELRARQFHIAIETNGTRSLPSGIHWTTVSPKVGTSLVVTKGDELKLVWPQKGGEPERYKSLDFTRFYLQPMDGPSRKENEQAAMRYCLDHPEWSLSLQIHKYLGID